MSAWTYRLSNGKATPKIVPPRLRLPCWKGLGADSEEKHEPASGVDTELVDSLKSLDPERPIREAHIAAVSELICLLSPCSHKQRVTWRGRLAAKRQNGRLLRLFGSAHRFRDAGAYPKAS